MSQAWLLPSQPEVAAEKGTKHNQGKIQPLLRFIFHPRPAAPMEFSLSPNLTMIFFKKGERPFALLGKGEVTADE